MSMCHHRVTMNVREACSSRPSASLPNARIIMQRCLSARLQVKPSSNDSDAEWVNIAEGCVVYICFLKGATLETVEKMASIVLNVKLSETADKNVSILDLPGSLLIIPQATLGGKVKGKTMQYHYNIEKHAGLGLYTEFVRLCRQAMESSVIGKEAGCTVKHGTYGNRQVLSVETNGPYTHYFEF
ncbi:D-aminoacyl-tRNA deacylase 2-like [Anneissia japonica]|uniref:D-aminoacyl-tRNA deacylase 2-like n=1 Tax=Anneissia japonica TaxID=1529436 RepID=UPI0014257841|nr:D-aminoacyl-tRNA deacylase 2-like [Anneissia japonica]